ncbi:hypothetical protein ACQKGC_25540 [Allorhizobium pseudoryzae]|jgi:hypothetical protein|uniref:hypothetical protein n=1 Tax=Allorhizobium pseudoryzae TaxID=379684 RepID=UPI003CFDC63A
MVKTVLAMLALCLPLPAAAMAQSTDAVIPVKTGAYAPASGGCDAAAAAFVYIEKDGIGANKTAGKILSVKQEGNSYVLDVLWTEVGSDEADGDRDTVRIDVKDNHSFYFSNTASQKTLMKRCN